MTNTTRREFIGLLGLGAVSIAGGYFVLNGKCNNSNEGWKADSLKYKNNWDKELSNFEQDLATLAISIDTLWGGDYSEKTGVAHLIVDAYCSGKNVPQINPPRIKELLIENGVEIADRKLLEEFIAENKVYECMTRIKDYTQHNSGNTLRKEYLQNLLQVFDVQLNMRLNMVGIGRTVSTEEAYVVAMGQKPDYISTQQVKESLRYYLEKAGLPVTNSKSFNERVAEWDAKTLVKAGDMETLWNQYSKELNKVSKERILPFLPGWITEIPEESVDFRVIFDKVNYSGINLAKHTIVDGKPVYYTTIRISSTATRAKADFKNLVAHEGRPGHALHIPIMHGLYAREERGFESTMMILCSPDGALAEGIAESTNDLLYGKDLAIALSNDDLIAHYLNDLNAAGRNNVVVKYIQGEKNQQNLRAYLEKEYCFTENNSKKYTNWLFDPKMGMLTGVMYLPSYGVAREKVKNAIEQYGREKVIPVVYGIKGQVDLTNFESLLK